MTTVKDILDFTETFAPLCTCAEWDNSGLLAGDENAEVSCAVLALDITKEVVEEAEDLGAELIISHHPVIFSPLKSLSSDSVPYLLAKSGISALCLHTNLDASSDNAGVNMSLARALALKEITLYPEEYFALGKLSEETTVRAFAKSAKSALGSPHISFTDGDRKIKTVAVSSGAGGSIYETAKAEGADALLTGEAKHHEYLEACAHGIALITAGHFHTEDVAIVPLKEKLSEHFPGISFHKSAKHTWVAEEI
ncbi:MAG: Nif3-like dinuclear metal center hexameric protein [Ruminococcus sp.]